MRISTKRVGQVLTLRDGVSIHVLRIKGEQVRLGVKDESTATSNLNGSTNDDSKPTHEQSNASGSGSGDSRRPGDI